MRALPFTYRHVRAEAGSIVTVTVVGDAGGSWHVERHADDWRQIIWPHQAATSTVVMDQDSAWKLLTKRRNLEAVRQQFPGIIISGDVELGSHALTMLSVMA